MTRNDIRSLHDYFNKRRTGCASCEGVQAQHRKRTGYWRHAQSFGKEKLLSGRQ